MAIQTRELVGSVSIASHPSIEPSSVQPKKFAAGTALLAVGTPIAFDTVAGTWKVWADAGLNGVADIKGFVFPEAVQLEAGGEVLGQVMITGRIAYTSVVLPAGETEANLKASLRSGPKTEGLIVSGLDQVR